MPFGNPFTNPFQQNMQQINPAYNNTMRLQAAGYQPPQPTHKNLFNWLLSALDFVDTKTRNPVVTGLDTLAQEGRIDLALQDAWKAFKGEKKTRGADLMGTLGIENPWVKGGAGFVTDILLDPVTWFGGWGTVLKPAKEGVSSAWKGALTSGLKKQGIKGAEEALKFTTKQYGKDLIEQVTKSAVAQGVNEGVAKEIARESIRQASRRGLTRGAAQNFAEEMLTRAGTEGITGDTIAKAAKALSKGSQKPLDLIGNELAKVISRPAMKLGETIGNIGPIGETAVGLHDWVGRSFGGRHFAKLMPGGIKEFMTDYDNAAAKLSEVVKSKDFTSALDKLMATPEGLTTETIQRAIDSKQLSTSEIDAVVQYFGLNDFVKKNPFTTFQRDFVATPIKEIDRAVRANQEAYAKIMQRMDKSLLAKLPEEDAKFLSTAIEAPIDYVENLHKTRKLDPNIHMMAKDAVRYQGVYERYLRELQDIGTDPVRRQELMEVLDIVKTADSKMGEVIKQYAKGNVEKESRLLDTAAEYLARMQENAMNFGIPESEALRYYVPHVYRNPQLMSDVQVKFVNRHPEIRNALGTYSPFEQHRTIPTLAAAEEAGFEPVKDLTALTIQYESKMAQKKVRTELIDRLIKTGNIVASKDVPSGAWVKDIAALNIPELRGMAIHRETYDLLKQLDGLLTSNEELKTLGRNWDKLHSLWKTSVTAMRPAWYVQNMTGNVVNSYLAGMKDPTRYVVAKDIMQGNLDKADKYLLNKLPKDVIDNLTKGKEPLAETVKLLFDANVGSGFGATPGATMWGAAAEASRLREGAKTGLQKLGSATSPKSLLAAGWDISNDIETNAKLALFIDGLAKGKSPKAAADVVKAALFDYSDLTKVEKGIRKIVPFYTYTRKNLAFQFQKLLETPERFQRIYGLQENLAAGHGFDMSNMSAGQRMKAMPIGADKYLNLGLPWESLTRVTDPKELIGMLSPAIKTPIELATNRDLYTGRPIQQYTETGTDWSSIAKYLANQFGASRDLAGAVSAARQSNDYMSRAEKSTTPQLFADDPNTLLRILGSVLYPVARQYDSKQAEEYQQKAYQRQLAELIRILQDQGVTVPTVPEIKRARKGRF